MQRIVALFAAFSLMFSGFFAGLPHAIYAWDKPTQTVTDTAKVLALYQKLATQNQATEFREKTKPGDMVDGNNSFLARYANAWTQAAMWYLDPASKVIKGLPGAPKNLKTSDISSAKAEYYHKGKTVVVTLKLKDQLDTLNAKSKNKSVATGIGSMTDKSFASIKVQVARLGYTLKGATMSYTNAKIMVRADAASGKITACDISYHAVISGSRNEIPQPFKQSFDYNVKRP